MINCRYRHQTGSEEFEIDTTTVLQMAGDLDMENEHETGVETVQRIFKS